MALFGKKAPTGTPTNSIIQMRQQGLSNDQIIQSLQREGYSSGQIFDAMNQADIKGVIESVPPAAIQQQPQQSDQTTPPSQIPPPQQYEEDTMPIPDTIPFEAAPMPMEAPVSISREDVEEIVEPIIDEKWDELMKSFDKIIIWKDETESKLVKIDQNIKDLKERFEELHKGILAKVGEYDQGIKNVGSDIKAMETVFKKVLPTFTENVGELSRLTSKLKKSRK